MKNLKAIFIDIEGTLKNKNKEVELETIKMIEKFENSGIHIILTTGLPRFISKNTSLKVKTSPYLISSNGADIYDLKNDCSIKSSYLKKDVVENIYHMTNKDQNIILGVGDFEYSNQYNEYNKYAKLITDIKKIIDIYQIHISQRCFELKDKLLENEIINFRKYYNSSNLMLYLNDDTYSKYLSKKYYTLTKEDKESIIRAIRFIKLMLLKNNILNTFHDEVRIGNQAEDFTNYQNCHETPWFTLNKKGINKGYGIKVLCDYLNIDPKDTIGFGNDYNDLAMKDAVGIFLSPSDARSYLIENKEFIYKEEEGIGKVLKKIYEG